MSDPGFKVPACTQCNSIRGDRIFKNLVERTEYLHKRLVVKLRKYLTSAYWEYPEIQKLGKNLRSKIEVWEARAKIAEDRIVYSAGPPDARWLDMELRWRKLHEPHEYSERRVVA